MYDEFPAATTLVEAYASVFSLKQAIYAFNLTIPTLSQNPLSFSLPSLSPWRC